MDLLDAAKRGGIEKVREILEAGVDPNIQNNRGYTALIWASEYGNTDIVKLLLDSGADPNIQRNNGHTPLSIAAEEGYTDIVRELLKAGADPNIKDYFDGRTALMFASDYGSLEIVKLLLNSGADPNIRDNQGTTTLMNASSVEIVKLLLYNLADPNLQTNDGETALMQTSIDGYIDIVKLLLDNGVDPNIQNSDGNTALTLASIDGYTEIVELLLNSGADPNIQDENGDTALTMASEEGHTDIIDLFERHMRTTRIQTRFRGRQTRRNAITQKAKQQIYTSLLPVDFDVSSKIGDYLSRMPHYPEVARRMKEEDENERISEYLDTLQHYGGKKKKNQRGGMEGEPEPERELLNAIKSNDYNKVELLLQEGVNPNGTFTAININKKEYTSSFLAEALHFSDLKSAELLLRHGADPSMYIATTVVNIPGIGTRRFEQTAFDFVTDDDSEELLNLFETNKKNITKMQSRVRVKRTRRKDRTQKAKQISSLAKSMENPSTYSKNIKRYVPGIAQNISEHLRRMPYNPDVAGRMVEEEQNERVAEYLDTLGLYGGGKIHKRRYR